MKVGSIVECVEEIFQPGNQNMIDLIDAGYTVPEVRSLYVVRRTYTAKCGTVALLFEEIINPPVKTTNGYKEVGFATCYFRELLPPVGNVENWIEECTDNTCKQWCGLNYCDENGCNNRKRNYIDPKQSPSI